MMHYSIDTWNSVLDTKIYLMYSAVIEKTRNKFYWFTQISVNLSSTSENAPCGAGAPLSGYSRSIRMKNRLVEE